MARKPAQDKWDRENMASQTIRVRRELLEKFKEACVERGDAVNGVLREAMERYVAGDVGGGPHVVIYGDGLKVLETFIQYATQDDNRGIADAMYYDSDELRRRVLVLKSQLEG